MVLFCHFSWSYHVLASSQELMTKSIHTINFTSTTIMKTYFIDESQDKKGYKENRRPDTLYSNWEGFPTPFLFVVLVLHNLFVFIMSCTSAWVKFVSQLTRTSSSAPHAIHWPQSCACNNKKQTKKRETFADAEKVPSSKLKRASAGRCANTVRRELSSKTPSPVFPTRLDRQLIDLVTSDGF